MNPNAENPTWLNTPRGALVLALLLAAMTLAVFWPAIGYDFIHVDDPVYVRANEHVNTGLSWNNIQWAFTSIHEGWYLPLLWVSYMSDATLLGMESRGFHLVNILLHAFNVVLLFWILKKSTKAPLASAFVAALFAIHPVRIESVVWIAERKDVLSGLFWMLAMLVHLRQAQKPSFKWVALIFIFMTMGLLSKASVITLPVALLLLDFWPLGRLQTLAGWKKCVAEKIPIFVLAGVFAVITLTTHQQSGGMFSPVTGLDRLSLIPGNYFPYLSNLFCPTNLSIYYPENDVVQWGGATIAGAVLLFITIGFWSKRNTKPYLLMGWLWFLVVLFPVIRGVRIGNAAFADRFLYLPSIGLFLVVTSCFSSLLRTRQWGRWLLGFLTVGILSLCATLTTYNLPFWENGASVFQRVWELDPTNVLGVKGRGVQFQIEERWDEALELYENTVSQKPFNVRFQTLKALALLNMGRAPEAVSQMEWLIQHAPQEAEFYYVKGLAHLQLQEAGFARQQLERAVQGPGIKPEFYYLELARSCFEDGDHVAADEALRHTLPHATAKLLTYGDLLPQYASIWSAGGKPRALLYFRNLATLESKNAGILNNIAWVLAVTEFSPAPPEEAINLAKKAAELSGANPTTLDTLAAAYANAGQFEDAVACALRAKELATAQGQTSLAARMEKRIQKYKQNEPWRELLTLG